MQATAARPPSAARRPRTTALDQLHVDPQTSHLVGTTTVTYTAMDAAGNTTTSSFTVTVTDDENPAISERQPTSRRPTTLVTTQCALEHLACEPTAADNCVIATFTSTHSPRTRLPWARRR